MALSIGALVLYNLNLSILELGVSVLCGSGTGNYSKSGKKQLRQL